jgi:hypothetical protein
MKNYYYPVCLVRFIISWALFWAPKKVLIPPSGILSNRLAVGKCILSASWKVVNNFSAPSH